MASVLQRESSWQVHQNRLCQKEQSLLSKSPDRVVGKSQGERELHLGERKGIRAGAWRGKSELYTEGRQVPRRRGRASKESLPRRSSRKHKRVSGHKSFLGESGESWFHSKYGQSWNEKRGWETKNPLMR